MQTYCNTMEVTTNNIFSGFDIYNIKGNLYLLTYLQTQVSIYSDPLDLHARCNIFISTCNIFMTTCLNYIFMSICNIFTCMLRSLLIKLIFKIYECQYRLDKYVDLQLHYVSMQLTRFFIVINHNIIMVHLAYKMSDTSWS